VITKNSGECFGSFPRQLGKQISFFASQTPGFPASQLLYMKEQKQIEQEITAYFRGNKDVCAVYLFGSYAKGKHGRFSDVDIAVLFDNQRAESAVEKMEQYSLDLGRRTRKDIHLSILDHAGENLAKQIFSKGKCLVVNNPKRHSQYKMVKFSMIAEFGYYKEKFHKSFIRKISESNPQPNTDLHRREESLLTQRKNLFLHHREKEDTEGK